MVNAGQRVVFALDGSYCEDTHGRRQYFKDRQGSYVMDIWMVGNKAVSGCNNQECKGCPVADTGFIGQEVRHI